MFQKTRESRQSSVESKIKMVFTFILNLSFIDATFQVKHLMTGHVLDGDFNFYNPASLMDPVAFCWWQISQVPALYEPEKVLNRSLCHAEKVLKKETSPRGVAIMKEKFLYGGKIIQGQSSHVKYQSYTTKALRTVGVPEYRGTGNFRRQKLIVIFQI